MGRSTTQELINRAKNINEYNNSAVATNAIWVDFFNAALEEMVEALNIEEETTLTIQSDTRLYDLPVDYYALSTLLDANGTRVRKRRTYDQMYPSGYWIVNKGSKYQIDLYNYLSPQTMKLIYVRYPKLLSSVDLDKEYPEVPTAGEQSLIYKAISHALKNNNELDQSAYYEKLYKREVARINSATFNAKGV